jgi:hypothetical protein
MIDRATEETIEIAMEKENKSNNLVSWLLLTIICPFDFTG